MRKDKKEFIEDEQVRITVSRWLVEQELEPKYKGFNIMVDILAYSKLNVLCPKITMFKDKELTDYITDKHNIKLNSIQRELRYAITVKGVVYKTPYQLLTKAYYSLDLTGLCAYQNFKIINYGF